MAVSWLRAVRRTGSKRALAVALALTLLLPRAHVQQCSEAPLGKTATSTAVEVVLPVGDKSELETPSAFASVPGGRGQGLTSSSRAAFVGPWRERKGGDSGGKMVATAVRASSKRPAAELRSDNVIGSPTEALESVGATVGKSAREIVEEFSGHIQVSRSSFDVDRGVFVGGHGGMEAYLLVFTDSTDACCAGNRSALFSLLPLLRESVTVTG